MPPKRKNKRKAEPTKTGSSSSAKKAKSTDDRSKKPASFPSKVSKNWTIAQLNEESRARGLDVGNIKHDKSFYLGVLGEGSSSVLGSATKTASANTTKASSKAPKSPVASKSMTKLAATKKSFPTKVKSSDTKSKASTMASKSTTSKPTATKKSTPTKVKCTGTISVASTKAFKSTTSRPKSTKKSTPIKDPKASTKASESTTSKPTTTKKPAPTDVKSSSTTSKAPKKASESIIPKPKATKKIAPTKIKSCDITPKASTKKSTPTLSNKSTSSITERVKTTATANTLKTPKTKSASAPDYQRITNKLTIAQLKDEAKARQLDPKSIPKLKADLLHHLVEGSIHVHESQEYKAYQALLNKVQSERDALYEQSLQKTLASKARKEELYLKQQAREEEKRAEEQRQRQIMREKEIVQQKSLHVHSFPRVHKHALAKSSVLKSNGFPRRENCDCCNRRNFVTLMARVGPAIYSCESCDWNICQQCFNNENMTEKEKQRVRLERQRKERLEEEENERRWNARKRFKTNIISPPDKNLCLNSKLKFTVWCSDGYDNDGWHSYEGEPDKEFDSSWNTKKEANDRAEYLFFWKNPWGCAPNEISDDDGDPKPSKREGLNNWTVSPPDSTRWSVGAVPANGYKHLPNATNHRHNYDSENDEDESVCF